MWGHCGALKWCRRGIFMKNTEEKLLQHFILEYLTKKKIFHYRNNTGAFKTERGGFYTFGMAGSPDIIAIIKGIYVGIEVKGTDIKKSKQNDNQIKFQEMLEKAGGLYILARTPEDVLKVIK